MHIGVLERRFHARQPVLAELRQQVAAQHLLYKRDSWAPFQPADRIRSLAARQKAGGPPIVPMVPNAMVDKKLVAAWRVLFHNNKV